LTLTRMSMSPGQPVRGALRGRLVLLLALWLSLVAVAITALVAIEQLPNPGLDFRHFWVAGHVWMDGISPYGDAFGQRARELVSGGYIPEIWPYPPSLWLPTAGLAGFSLETAWAIWLALQTLCLIASGALVAYGLPEFRLPSRRGGVVRVPRLAVFGAILTLMTVSEPSTLSISGGQFSQFLLLAATLIVTGFVRGRDLPVIVGLVIFFMKPHIGAPSRSAF